MQLWTEIARLERHTLYTLDQRKPFDIVEVKPRAVVVRPHARDVERTISREAIEGAFGELVARGEITRTDIREKYANFNPAYVAAILAALPGVETKLKPILLRFKTGS